MEPAPDSCSIGKVSAEMFSSRRFALNAIHVVPITGVYSSDSVGVEKWNRIVSVLRDVKCLKR